jgi:hypothetical protein
MRLPASRSQENSRPDRGRGLSASEIASAVGTSSRRLAQFPMIRQTDAARQPRPLSQLAQFFPLKTTPASRYDTRWLELHRRPLFDNRIYESFDPQSRSRKIAVVMTNRCG